MNHTFEEFKKIVDERFRYYAGDALQTYAPYMNSKEYADEVQSRFKETQKPGKEKAFASIAASCAYCLWNMA